MLYEHSYLTEAISSSSDVDSLKMLYISCRLKLHSVSIFQAETYSSSMKLEAVIFSLLHWVISHILGISMPLSLQPQRQYTEDMC